MVAVTYGVAGVATSKNTGRGRASSPRQNIFTRLLTALFEARLRQAYREITRHPQLLEHARALENGSQSGGW